MFSVSISPVVLTTFLVFAQVKETDLQLLVHEIPTATSFGAHEAPDLKTSPKNLGAASVREAKKGTKKMAEYILYKMRVE